MRAVAAIGTARELALAAIEDAESAHQAFTIAGELMVLLRDVADEIANRRAQQAVRIRDEEALSLSELAKRIGVSKGRAGQLMQQQEKGNTND